MSSHRHVGLQLSSSPLEEGRAREASLPTCGERPNSLLAPLRHHPGSEVWVTWWLRHRLGQVEVQAPCQVCAVPLCVWPAQCGCCCLQLPARGTPSNERASEQHLGSAAGVPGSWLVCFPSSLPPFQGVLSLSSL